MTAIPINIVDELVGNAGIHGFATLALTCFFFGPILSMLGVLGKNLWRVFVVVKGMSATIIDRTFL